MSTQRTSPVPRSSWTSWGTPTKGLSSVPTPISVCVSASSTVITAVCPRSFVCAISDGTPAGGKGVPAALRVVVGEVHERPDLNLDGNHDQEVPVVLTREVLDRRRDVGIHAPDRFEFGQRRRDGVEGHIEEPEVVVVAGPLEDAVEADGVLPVVAALLGGRIREDLDVGVVDPTVAERHRPDDGGVELFDGPRAVGDGGDHVRSGLVQAA